ncbi:MAG: DUF134 domain-containing protein [Hadesarchaea archaeon]|nr:DUF134 domain-containing protein [Hadesarchaea archaeon]
MEPWVTRFGPIGPGVSHHEVVLTVDEFESVRLKDLEGLSQEEGAKQMGISQPTFHRILVSARRKIADALVNGKAIRIEGGSYVVVGRGPGRRWVRRRWPLSEATG